MQKKPDFHFRIVRDVDHGGVTLSSSWHQLTIRLHVHYDVITRVGLQSLQNKYEDCVYTLNSVRGLIINCQPIWTLSIESGLGGKLSPDARGNSHLEHAQIINLKVIVNPNYGAFIIHTMIKNVTNVKS